MAYSVKELFLTLQGEGGHAGRAAVFCRFAGCNLWSGREADREMSVCRFCDTDFVGTDGENGGKYEAEALADLIAGIWVGGDADRFVVFTGGEPLLQLDEPLLEAVRARGFFTAVESNGTVPAPEGVDWLCVSPKAGAPLRVRAGQELKLVFPQKWAEPEQFESLEFEHFFLQPMDGPERDENTRLAVEYCLLHPRWRLSLQTHKLIGIP
ncbi:7-carboxy-7-deazaguanine synthase, Cx14CxxC type [Rhodoblastus acidophilus]|uniref:7-carboxy-7-deazaguanine synthase n=1 Tax=Rhodoblastus acidophilus TaxID=1074 RepID=A0A212RIW4_RHOAC|nr:7-carboxy-7-deazaguanine synthase [Rhodoblastus acidophilus]PPQ38087.1 7-carboxy-7-deazaguanine synthase [Rhodoblastus acidophilus]RAI17846.1 7-carboxy-7-deazaguanine synthase [Rhodoblastus acidophilus]SNB72236.1 7-carboxy-7-deazaguanine synthase, Cx14CxxC type [Rhodoblastus acidophilus]